MSDGALFTEAEAWDGDALRPDLEVPTPAEVVASLTRRDRVRRLDALLAQSQQIVEEALREHRGGREIVGRCVLFSGGSDSTVLAHIFRDEATHAIHANTTIGIEQTRQFVRDTCATWGLPLIEKTAPTPYRDLVIEQGFPGPAMHWKMFQRLKERCLRAAVRELVTDSRRQRVLFLAGRRRAESRRRQGIPLHERVGSTIWASPLALWTKLDLNTYRLTRGDVPVNPVSGLLHMSGECLCGAFAHPGELDEIAEWFPEVVAEIRQLEADVRAAGHAEPLCRWGHGEGRRPNMPSGRLCSSCDARYSQQSLDLGELT